MKCPNCKTVELDDADCEHCEGSIEDCDDCNQTGLSSEYFDCPKCGEQWHSSDIVEED